MIDNKKGQERTLSAKTRNKRAASYVIYDLSLTTLTSLVNNSNLGKPYNVLTCWLCGTDKSVQTVHKSDGVLGVCISCMS